MLARVARRSDAKALDELLQNNQHGDVRLDRDVIAVVGEPVPTGVLVWRPCALVHELVCPGLLSANALINFAVGQAAGRPFTVRDALFVIDPSNDAMLRHAKRLGAVESTGRIYTLDIGG